MDEPVKNLTFNRITGGWELLTFHQWHLTKHLYPIDCTTVNEWDLFAFDESEIGLAWCFDLHYINDKGTIEFLVNLRNEWPRPINTGEMLYNWREFLLDIYDFPAKREFLNKLHKLKVSFQRAALEQIEAKRELQEYTTKKAKIIHAKLQKLKRKKARR